MTIGNENEFVEFKETLAEKEEAMKDMGAILNKHGRGSLYFGLNDRGEVLGLEVGKRTESDLANKINTSIEPTPFYSIETKMDSTGKKFIEVDFHGDAKPYRSKGLYCIRNGERSDVMPTSLLSEMLIQTQKSYDVWENASSDAKLEDIDEALIKSVIDTGNELNRILHPYEGVEDSLRFLNLFNADGRINKAGEALFSKRRPLTCRLSVLGDVEGSVFLDMQLASGNIFELIERAYNYVSVNLNYAVSPNPNGVERLVDEEIPSVAIRELIVNAFGHAFYLAPFSHDVAVYPNRIAIFNPGPFPPDGKPEDFASKTLKPIDKNTRVNFVLYFRNYIEHFGSGFTKIFKALERKKITYRYHNQSGGFVFEVFRPGKVQIANASSLNDYQKVLQIMQQDAYASIDSIALLLGKSRPTVNRIIASLKKNGKVERAGSRKDGRWILK